MHCGTHLLSSGAPIPSGLACFQRALIFRQPGWSARFENITIVSPGILVFFLYSAGTRIELAVRSIIVKARRLKQRNHIINVVACFGRDLLGFAPTTASRHPSSWLVQHGSKRKKTRYDENSYAYLSSFLFSIYLL